MPKVRRGAKSRKPPPEGWELIEPTLEELEQKMREAETDSHEGKRKVEALWPIFKIHHQKARYIFDLFYRRKAISRELYDFCINDCDSSSKTKIKPFWYLYNLFFFTSLKKYHRGIIPDNWFLFSSTIKIEVNHRFQISKVILLSFEFNILPLAICVRMSLI